VAGAAVWTGLARPRLSDVLRGYKVQTPPVPTAVREAVARTRVGWDWEPRLALPMEKTSGGNPVAYNPQTKAAGLSL